LSLLLLSFLFLWLYFASNAHPLVSKKPTDYAECTLQIKQTNGKALVGKFKPDDTIAHGMKGIEMDCFQTVLECRFYYYYLFFSMSVIFFFQLC
jgi:hypothetical protein